MDRSPEGGNAGGSGPQTSRSAPRWLILLTAALTLVILFMAVAETTLWTHFLIDQGELVSIAGLAFILVAGLVLHRRGQLFASLPLIVPWLMYPVITQADEIIDNLTIDQMRLVCHFILAILFGAPIAVLVLAARHFLAPRPGRPARRRRWTLLFPGLRLIERGSVWEGSCLTGLALLLLEVWVADQFLGRLMVYTLIGMGLVILYAAAGREPAADAPDDPGRRARRNRLALVCFLTGVAVSGGLYLGFKNRPGAYQGSPSFYHDPKQKDAAYPLDRVVPPSGRGAAPAPELAAQLGEVLTGYGRALERLVHAYYILDRNYNYSFHNALFLRHTPVLADFRKRGLEEIAVARGLVEATDARLDAIRATLPAAGGLAALLDDVHGYVAYNLRRASILEEMSARFEQTEAGLQHATHLYEGEGKLVGEQLMKIVDKHGGVLEDPDLASVAVPFVAASRKIQGTYANRIVGF